MVTRSPATVMNCLFHFSITQTTQMPKIIQQFAKNQNFYAQREINNSDLYRRRVDPTLAGPPGHKGWREHEVLFVVLLVPVHFEKFYQDTSLIAPGRENSLISTVRRNRNMLSNVAKFQKGKWNL